MLRKEEEFARQRLIAFFAEQGMACEVIEGADPPDLVVKWPSTVAWGVEVTRADHHLPEIGTGTPKPARGVMEALKRFGDDLGKKTKALRKRAYVISLSPPDALNPGIAGQSWKDWKTMVETAVLRHLEEAPDAPLTLQGCRLRFSHGPAGTWRVWPTSGLLCPDSEADKMIRNALATKAEGLARWPEGSGEKWLFLFVEGAWGGDVISPAWLEQCREELDISPFFDGIFWMLREDRTSVQAHRFDRPSSLVG
ncbi:hypothetical protein [Pseudooceanicola aestuarii]|uniref:hypothetical protein n=1 Tax=Pseudooceanicola aestuarii TaxID=2697319 RepID=UPI0013D69A43|nr:hypothetical protein [Pseudooceanicola aestuarii]